MKLAGSVYEVKFPVTTHRVPSTLLALKLYLNCILTVSISLYYISVLNLCAISLCYIPVLYLCIYIAVSISLYYISVLYLCIYIPVLYLCVARYTISVSHRVPRYRKPCKPGRNRGGSGASQKAGGAVSHSWRGYLGGRKFCASLDGCVCPVGTLGIDTFCPDR